MEDFSNPLRVKKEQFQCVLIIRGGVRVQGVLHGTPDLRFIDYLNSQPDLKPFIAVTNATIILPSGEKSKARFLAINRGDISIAYPVE